MLQYRTLAPASVELLKQIMLAPFLTDFTLAGGTALALQIGHRESYDLDLFSRAPFSTEEIFLKLNQEYAAELVSKSEHILVAFIRGIKVDCVFHPYTFKYPVVAQDGIRLLHIEDIAAMKLSAIAGRGRKRDFFDLYFLLREFPLHQMLDWYADKYGDSSTFHAVRSLTYFEDAEADADPVLFEQITWEQVKQRLVKAVGAL
ncbi:MAG: nucleotidyl transferase AbiEii/AbiGii toxin family protein [Saprospiraceae bacterium]|nr:nucleotidyl transferase AbiEii/AbiGii toxin family protein [Saprospiraceae bacterium]